MQHLGAVGGAYLLHVLLAAMNLYATISLVANIDGTAVQQRLAGRLFEKARGGVLISLGVVFSLWAISVMVNSLFKVTPRFLSDSRMLPGNGM